jgi:hypothetical protein
MRRSQGFLLDEFDLDLLLGQNQAYLAAEGREGQVIEAAH